MTRAFTLILLSLLLTGQIWGQEQIQNSLIVKRTATWCSTCGGNAWDIMSDLVTQHEGQAVIQGAHHSSSSDLHHPDALALIEGLEPSFGQPVFFHNGDNIGGGIAATQNTLDDLVAQTAMQGPLAQTELVLGYDSQEDDVYVQAQVRFFEGTSGTYHLSVFLVEKEVVGFQQNRGPNAVHKRVFRGAITEEVFGEEIASGSIGAGNLYFWEGGLDVSDYALDNLQFAAVIWERQGDSYQFVNAIASDQIELIDPTSIREAGLAPWRAKLLSAMGNGVVRVEVQSPEALRPFSIELLDLQGRHLGDLYAGTLLPGIHQLELPLPFALPTGMYLLRLRSGSHFSTLKAMIR